MGLVMPRPETPPRIRRPGSGRPVGRPSVWAMHLERIAAAGGEWMAAGEYASANSAQTIMKYIRRRYDPEGRFQFTARTVDGRGVLYARLKPEGGK